MLFKLSRLLETIPVWGQILIAIFLVGFSIVSVYGRIDLGFGAKAFSRIPRHRLRSDVGHIVQYTVIPVITTIGFLVLLYLHHFGEPGR